MLCLCAPCSPQPQSGKKGLSGGQIAGICIGVLLGLALAGLVALLAVRRMDKRVRMNMWLLRPAGLQRVPRRLRH